MRTYIDEGALWIGQVDVETQRSAVDDACDLIEEVLDHSDEFLLWSVDAYDAEVHEGKTLTEFLYPEEHVPELRDATLRLAITLQKATFWEDSEWEVDVDDYDVAVEGSTRCAPSLAQAHAVARTTEPTCAVGFATGCSPGAKTTTVAGYDSVVWWATDCTSRLAFVRAWLQERALPPMEFLDFLDRAFPDLLWAAGASNGLRTNSGCFFGPDLAATIHHLGVLNDHASLIFATESEPAVRQAKLGAIGVQASPESPNTRGNKDARRERRVTWKKKEVYFWWHTKIRYDQGRIHFVHEMPDEGNDAPNGRIVVGICAKHLTT
jgi:hypothetical protein